VAEPSETTRFTPGPAQPESADPDREELLAAIRTLSAQVGGLQSEVQSLRAQNRTASLPAAGSEVPGWDRAPARRESSAWIRSLDGPVSRAPAVPRLLLEVVFLVAVAVAAVIAKLDALVIVAIMILAWGLVALAEWFAARAAKEQAEIAVRPLAGLGGVLADDPAWFRPPVERSVLEPVPAPAEDDEDTQDKLKPQPTV
jgi:hypothetical protein